MTPGHAERLRAQLSARYPEASGVRVTPDDDGAKVEFTAAGVDYKFSVTADGPLLRYLLRPPGEPG